MHDRCNYFSFWAIFCITAWKIKITEKWKNSWRYHHLTIAYQKSWSYARYCSWDMVPDRCNYFSFWAIFCPFIPLTAKKNQNLKKMKKTPTDIIILHMCTKNYDQMMYGSWDIVRNRWTDGRMDRGTDRRMDKQSDGKSEWPT